MRHDAALLTADLAQATRQASAVPGKSGPVQLRLALSEQKATLTVPPGS